MPHPSSFTGIAPSGELHRLPFPLHPCCNGRRRLAGLKTAENGAGFFGALLKGKELHVLKPLNFERFRVSFPENVPLFSFIVTDEGVETNFGVWSLAWKLKILGRLSLFRFFVTGVDRLQ